MCKTINIEVNARSSPCYEYSHNIEDNIAIETSGDFTYLDIKKIKTPAK